MMAAQTEKEFTQLRYQLAFRHDHMPYPHPDRPNRQNEQWDWTYMLGWWGYYSKENLFAETAGKKVTHLKVTSPVCMELIRLWAPDITHLRIKRPSEGELEEIVNIFSQLNSLKSLDIGDTHLRNGVPKVLYKLKSLTNLNLNYCGLQDLPDCLSVHLTNLEALNLSGNRFYRIPTCIKKLKKLKILKIHRCLDDGQHDSGFSQLSELEGLTGLCAGGNDYSTGLPPALLGLSQIKELGLGYSKLQNKPENKKYYDNLEGLTNLERFSLRNNSFSTYGLPEQVCKLQTLMSLTLSCCHLHQLPDSITNLKQLKGLKLDGNPLQKLPLVICNLSMLERLNVENCELDDLPERLAALEKLVDLNIGGSRNKFKSLPSVILQMERLERLVRTDSTTIKELGRGILTLRRLTQLHCLSCHALEKPPSQVCAQGLHAIKKYYTDIECQTGRSAIVPVISIAVIGSSMAGKTSLVESLKSKKRILMYRDKDAPADDTTEVFEVKDISLNNSKLRCFDVGGNDAYQLARQFTIRNSYIPVIVVSMKDFMDMRTSAGNAQASKLMIMNHLSHFYISCPKLGPPILVLTHIDCLSKAEFTECKEQLLSTSESLRLTMVEEEARYSRNSSRFCKIEHFSNTDRPLFKSEDIHVFSNDLAETENIHCLLRQLESHSKSHEQVIPDIWNEIESFFDLHSQLPYVLLQAILDAFPDDTDSVILRFKHDVGRVLWFERDDRLCDYVFHRIDLVTGAISALFHHKGNEIWQKRIDEFQPFHFKEKWMTKEKYRELVNKFLRSGVLDEVLLYTAFSDREFPVQTAIALLKTFHLVCGPISAAPRDTYIIPAISADIIEETMVSECLLPLRVGILFVGLPPPPYVYHLLTVAFLNLFASHEFRIRAASNGAVVHHGASISRVTHNSEISELTVQVDTPVEELDASWRLMKKAIHHILRCSLRKWEGARPICKFFCSHCLLLRLPNPDVDLDPDWMIIPNENDSAENESEWISEFRGAEPVPCCNDRTNGGPLTVLKPLRYPCDSLNGEELKKVKLYVAELAESMSGLPKEIAVGVSASSQTVSSIPASVTQPGAGVPEETAKSEMDYVEEIVSMMKHFPAVISLSPSQESLVTAPTSALDKEYKMTEPLGRALIISNKYLVTDQRTGNDHWRRGSEHDYTNMRQMLDRLNFITAGEHKNYTAKDMVDAIHKETQLVDEYTGRSIHEGFGMFVLVLTSHGNDGSILGCDYTRIKLTDIYDLLSARNFPAMKGKPKLIIIQACSGEKLEMMLDGVPGHLLPTTGSTTNRDNTEIGHQSAEATAQAAVQSYHQQAQQPDEFDLDPQNVKISVADLLIMQSSFDSFASPRSPVLGSPFIRAVVLTFSKMASQYDVETMSNVVREAVSRYSAERSEEIMLTCPPSERHRAFIAQMPKSVCTFTGLRKLYLRPSDLSNQTQNQPQDEIEGDVITRIQWLTDIVTEWTTEGVRSGACFLRWKVEKISASNSSAGPA